MRFFDKFPPPLGILHCHDLADQGFGYVPRADCPFPPSATPLLSLSSYRAYLSLQPLGLLTRSYQVRHTTPRLGAVRFGF